MPSGGFALEPASADELALSTRVGDRLLGGIWSAGSGYTGSITLRERTR